MKYTKQQIIRTADTSMIIFLNFSFPVSPFHGIKERKNECPESDSTDSAFAFSLIDDSCLLMSLSFFGVFKTSFAECKSVLADSDDASAFSRRALFSLFSFICFSKDEDSKSLSAEFSLPCLALSE